MEISSNNKINFLDVIIIIHNDIIIFDNYNKSTCSGFLNFHSHHPPYHKNGVIINLVDRILILSYLQFHQINLTEVIST